MDLDFKKIDLYELFDIGNEATEAEIKKSYRKKALIYHPDKNPDNPKANEIFQKLSKALEVLTDKDARASYDKILNARKEREIKYRKLDDKRRKLKDDLEAQERLNQDILVRNEEEKLKQEIERIRKEGYVWLLTQNGDSNQFYYRSKQLEDENYLLKTKIEQQKNEAKSNKNSSSTSSNRVKIKRKGKKTLDEDLIHETFSKFGKILFVIVSKNNRSAIVEFGTYDAIKLIAINCPSSFEFEIISVNKTAPLTTVTSSESKQPISKVVSNTEPIGETTKPTVIEDSQDDYEDYVLRRLQEAEKNKCPIVQ